jgi:hypothetical protein
LKIFPEIVDLSIRPIFLVLALLISLLNLSCSDTPSSIGADLLPRDLVNISELDSSVDSLYQSANIYKRVIALSGADRLLLGKKDNVEAGILIKFLIYIADSIDEQLDNNELTVQSSFIKFTKNYVFGDSLAQLDYTVHKINSDWSTGFTSDSLSLLMYDASDVSFNKSFSDSVNSFYINNDLALSWLKAIADSNTSDYKGLYIKPTNNSAQIIGFQALSTYEVPIPYLYVVIEKPGVYVDTLSYFPSLDLSVVSGSLPDLGAEDIGIQAGLNSEARLFFDLSSLSKQIIVNYAELTLTVDTIKTVTGSNFTNSLRVNYVTDSTNNSIDSSLLVFLDRDSNHFKGDVTVYVQKALLENNNQGFILAAGDKINGVELFAIKGSNAAVFEERPRLKIKYTSRK